MASRRQESGDDKRGNYRDRYARKTWLLTTPKFGGNGNVVPCVHCGAQCTRDELHADRIIPGGSYRRENVQPACAGCNIRRGNKVEWIPTRQLQMA
jgi:5-methylcytosine-specific restriction endonuclease McrA